MSANEGSGHGNLTVFLAFLGGAAVGAAVALLLAPRSGAETRKRLVGVAGDAGEAASRTAKVLGSAVAAGREAYQAALATPSAPAPSAPPPHRAGAAGRR